MLDFLLNSGTASGLKFGFVATAAVTLVLGAIWLYMIYDCAKNEKDEKIRALWIAVLLVGKFLAVLVYFFGVWLPRHNKATTPTTPFE